jgi:hypothetical protein
MKHFLRDILQGTKNLIYWLPIIWKDRDWDHVYIERMLEHKLQRVYKRFSDPNETYVDWESESSNKALKALHICLIILKRRREEWYITNLYEHHFNKETVKLVIEIEDRDRHLLYTLMDKYSELWWD